MTVEEYLELRKDSAPTSSIHRRKAIALRKWLRGRDNGVCAICGLDCIAFFRHLENRSNAYVYEQYGFNAEQRRARFWTVDHIVPTILGGSHNLENLQTLCFHCHEKKNRGENAVVKYCNAVDSYLIGRTTEHKLKSLWGTVAKDSAINNLPSAEQVIHYCKRRRSDESHNH